MNGVPTNRHLLADGDEIRLGVRARLIFRLPTALTGTALLELCSGLRISGDVRKVLLLDSHLIIGAAPGAHVVVPGLKDRVILSAAGGRFRCRAAVPVAVDGVLGSRDETIVPGAHVEAGSVAFTVTAVPRGGERGGEAR